MKTVNVTVDAVGPLVPVYYSPREGVRWEVLQDDSICQGLTSEGFLYDPTRVHALLFAGRAVGDYLRWDCLNGFTGFVRLEDSEYPVQDTRVEKDTRKPPKGQSRFHSFLESCANIALGFGIAITAQMLIFPLFNIHIGMSENLQIGVLFTLVSLARSYALRRLFNWYHVRILK